MVGSSHGVRLCFPFIAQIHQTLHSLPIALEIARRHPDAEVRLAATTPEHLAFARRIAAEHYPDARVAFDLLHLPALVRASIPQVEHGIAPKLLALWCNRDYFAGFDAIVTPERTSLLLRNWIGESPRLIWTRHGAGDRGCGFAADIARFDFVLLAGRKVERRLLEAGLIRPGRYAGGVYAKLDLLRHRERPRLFDNDRPTVVYNPHFRRRLSSWSLVGRQVLDHFAASDRYNLIFAPHMRLFYPADAHAMRRFADYAALPHMLVDLGSERLVDMSYTLAADLYLGDVSSQVAEFLLRPRPCLFLNPHRTDWRGDPNYASWSLAPVIEDVGALDDGLEEAFASHAAYRRRQQAYVADALGPGDDATAPIGADAIMDFLHGGHAAASAEPAIEALVPAE